MDEQTTFETRAVLGPNRGPGRILILVPAVVLAGAVWFGISGASPETTPRSTVAVPTQEQAVHAYPATALGLQVRTLADVAVMPLGTEAVTAVAGWYVGWPPLGCFIADATEPPSIVADLGIDADVRTFCNRSGVLIDAPSDLLRRRSSTPGLFVVLAPGVVVPPVMAVADAAAVEVVLVGRIVAMRQPTDQVTADRQFLVDGVAWANGAPWTPTTTILPKLLDQEPNLGQHPRDALAEAIIGPTGAVLIDALVDPATLAFVDPDAGALVASTSPKSERIWYRLALNSQPDRLAPRWLALDDLTGAVIGTGIQGNPSVIVVSGAGDDASAAPGPRLPLDGTNITEP